MNRAAEDGPKLFDWWPDWRGECAAVVASGPSIKEVDLSVLRDRIHVLVIKTTVDRVPWAEVCYGCDAPWWIDRKGLPSFKGLKMYHGVNITSYPWSKNMRRVKIEMSKDNLLVDEPLALGNGGNSGFQGLNLVTQFGATSIMLVGFDCKEHKGLLHWYGRNTAPGMNNPDRSNFNRWAPAFEIAKRDAENLGVEIVNCSPISSIKSFKKMSINETLEEWGL